MIKIVTTSNATPSVQKTSKTLALSIVKVHPSNSNILAEMASENGCRLLQTCDLDSLSKDQIEKLKEVLKAVGWLKLGDKPGLSSSNASELKEKMEKVFGEAVNVFPGGLKLVLHFDRYPPGFGISASYPKGLDTPVLALVKIESESGAIGLERL